VLYDTLRTPSVNKGLTMIYHIAWMTVGNTILLNLLMGIMLDSMKEEEEQEANEEKAKKNH
jgi:glucose uptake protein GlcU